MPPSVLSLLLLLLKWGEVVWSRDFAAPSLPPDHPGGIPPEDGDEESLGATPRWFWENRTAVPPALFGRLSGADKQGLPNLIVTGPETTGSSSMIAQLARHPEVVQLGEVCWLCRDKELEQLGPAIPSFVAKSFVEIEAERAALIRRRSAGDISAGTATLARVGYHSEAAAYSTSSACAPMEPYGVRVRAEKCQNYFHHPFAPFWVRRASDPENPTRVVIMIRNPIARACSRYSTSHRLTANGEEHPLFSDIRLVRAYRSCRAANLERNLCNRSHPFFSSSAAAACQRIALDTDIESVVEKEKVLSDALYGVPGHQQQPLPRDERMLDRVERIEWDMLWRCYRPFRRIRHSFYPALYAEHLRRWTYVLGLDRILLVSQEDLLDRPAAAMNRVWAFAGLQPECATPPETTTQATIVNSAGDISNAPSALEYGRRRCASSLVNAELIHQVYANSIQMFYTSWMNGLDLGWEAVLHPPIRRGLGGIVESLDI